MHRRKISVRLVMNLAFIAAALITAVIVNIYPLIYAENLAFLSGESYVLPFSRDIAEKISGLSVVDGESLDGVCSSFIGIGSRRLIITDGNGRVLYDNATVSDITGIYLLGGDILSALDGEEIYRSRYSDGAFYSYSVIPLFFSEGDLGVVCFFDTNAELGAEIRAIQGDMFLISLVPCALFISISVLLSGWFSRLLGKILAGIGRIKSGQYSNKIGLSGVGEFREIADSLDSLGETLQESHEMTRRFVSDASHELKTPLATIKLLSDSIIQTSKISLQEVREFLLDINEEIDRLARISGRLLQISRLEDTDTFTGNEILDVKPIAESVCRRLSPLAAAANCTLRSELSDGCFVNADYDNMYQIFYNLIENAIKYSGQDNEVKVLLFLRDNDVVFIVDDYGEGIPEQDLKKIFDRFYRVDKARARATGGTGLGLSIVASAVEQCGGSVSAENRPGGGARFTVKFPKSDQPLLERRDFI